MVGDDVIGLEVVGLDVVGYIIKQRDENGMSKERKRETATLVDICIETRTKKTYGQRHT